MESKKLEALLTAVDLGSFTKAAEVLGYTQSGLTHMMNALEKELGIPLLMRGHYGVRLTPEGERLQPLIREYLRVSSQLDNEIAKISSSRDETIRVAAYASMAMHWLPRIIQRFRQDHPNVNVDIRMADHVAAPYEWLLQGQMDLIFASNQNYTGCDWIHLKNDTMYAILPCDYPVGGMTSFPISEFNGKEFLMPSQGYDRDILRVFNRLSVKPDVRPTSVDDATVVMMVEHGLGISMMSELTIRGCSDRVRKLPVEPASFRELGIAVRSLNDAPPLVRQFITYARRTVAEDSAR